MNFGGRIQSVRDELRLTQAEVADRARSYLPDAERSKLKQQTIQTIEARDSRRSNYAAVICQALGIRLEWGLTGQGPKWLTDAPVAEGRLSEQAARYGAYSENDRVLRALATIHDSMVRRLVLKTAEHGARGYLTAAHAAALTALIDAIRPERCCQSSDLDDGHDLDAARAEDERRAVGGTDA